ncbi:MAG: hypothetical protein IMZ59_04685 [Actinobacteria bacterium]|nr:hypothetical protein [Actinomycetota bacterium]
MQLTKDDVYEDEEEMNTTRYFDKSYTPKIIKKIDFSKFLEVRKFYEEHKDSVKTVIRDHSELFEKYMKTVRSWDDWLYDYCFKDGLK